MKKEIDIICQLEQKTSYKITLFESAIPAGFPSIAEDYVDRALDLNELLIKHPAATFFVRVKGDSMINAGINSNDILIVDRALTPTNNKIVIARLNGQMTVKRIKMEQEKVFLVADNPKYSPIEITSSMDFEVWGVVTCILHQV